MNKNHKIMKTTFLTYGVDKGNFRKKEKIEKESKKKGESEYIFDCFLP